MDDFISSFVSRKHGLKRDPSILTLLYSPMTDFVKNLVKNGLFWEILQTKIHLETTQKVPNDHLADEVVMILNWPLIQQPLRLPAHVGCKESNCPSKYGNTIFF